MGTVPPTDRRDHQFPALVRLESGSTGIRWSPAGPRSRCSTPHWSSPTRFAGAGAIWRWCCFRPSGRTSPSTASTISSGPQVQPSSSSAWRPCGPAGCSYRYRRTVPSSGATLLAVAFGLWGLHHLDYPFLRARGAWAPWGYYLDILLALAVGAGILLLVLDDLRRGLGALSALSGDLQRAGREQDVLDALLARPLTLPAVRGSALYLVGAGRRTTSSAGPVPAANWPESPIPASGAALLARVIQTGRPQFSGRLDRSRAWWIAVRLRRAYFPSCGIRVWWPRWCWWAMPATRSRHWMTPSCLLSAIKSEPRWKTPISTAGSRPAQWSWRDSRPV